MVRLRIGLLAAGTVLGAALAAGAGCSHQATTNQESLRPAEKSTWEDAWDSVAAGGENEAHAGAIVVERSQDGAIEIWRGTKQGMARIGEPVSDATILSSVKTQLRYATNTDAGAIDVQVKNGEVTLTGTLDTPLQAREAVKIAFETHGVRHVRSRLRWKT